MITGEKEGTRYYRFSNLSMDAGVSHAVFTRNEGDERSAGVTTDDPSSVKRNRRMIAKIMGTDAPVFARQVHGIDVLVIGKGDEPEEGGVAGEGDAMITNVPGKFLAVQVADCQPVLMHDPARGVVAAVHSGWRGSVANIIGVTVDAMKARYGCNPGDIRAGIGPSLGPCCAEFINYRTELPEPFHRFKDNRDHFDFWAASREQLTAAGVPGENIEIGDICTVCNTDTFYSYRGEKDTGRFVGVIGLRS